MQRDEIVKQVIEHWHNGLSAMECARACSLPTRNTAMGIVARHKAAGCEQCGVRAVPKGGYAAASALRSRNSAPRAPRQVKEAPLPPPVALAPIGLPRDIPTGGCRYIEAEFSRDFQMCGHPQEVGAWCAAHAARVYNPQATKAARRGATRGGVASLVSLW